MKIARSLMLLLLLAGVSVAVSAEPAHAAHVHWRPSVNVYWGPGWGWYDPWWAYGPRWGYPVAYPGHGYGAFGALDTDVSPERAEVWVDGKKVGLADDYDGFPDYLWLEKGTYDVVLYLPGYKTIARQYTIYPGMVIDVEDRMEAGEAIHPTALGPTTHARREARLRDDEDRAQTLERYRAERGIEAPEPGGMTEGAEGAPEASETPLDARSEPGRLTLKVTPDDASVYLDGRFLGTGRELAGLRAGLIVDPGTHKIEVVRPGRESAERTVEVESGQEVPVEIALDSD